MIDSLAAATTKLRDLAAARSPHGEFLTVTLSTSRLDDWRQLGPTFLNSESARMSREGTLSKDQKHALESEIAEIAAVLQYDLTDSTQGLALFADGDGSIYQRIELPFRLINRLVLEPSPYIRPVVHALSLLEPFIVARVSRDESSLYLVDEWGGVAGGGRDGVIDAAGDGPAQVAGEGQPRRQPLSPITLTKGLKRLGVGRTRIILRPFAAGVIDKG